MILKILLFFVGICCIGRVECKASCTVVQLGDLTLQPCVFPFWTGGVLHHSCTTFLYRRPWCPTRRMTGTYEFPNDDYIGWCNTDCFESETKEELSSPDILKDLKVIFEGRMDQNKTEKIYYKNGDLYKGEVNDKIPWGKGIFTHPNKETYTGEWVNGQRHGSGTVRYSLDDEQQRHLFDGTWKEDQRSGHGIMVWKNRTKYIGHYQGDLEDGLGKLFYSNNSEGLLSYEGYWSKGQKSGYGIDLYAKNNMKYEGSFSNGLRNGLGKLTFTKGNLPVSFEGNWQNGKRSGHGSDFINNTLLFQGFFIEDVRNGIGKVNFRPNNKGLISYEGNWSNGKMSGFGTTTFSGNKKFEGFFEDNKFNGKGKLFFEEESPYLSYEGEWKNNKRPQQGILLWKRFEGRIYSGEFKNNSIDGQGKIIFEEDNSYLSYEGEWKNGEMSGQGILNWKRPKGKTYTGELKNNKINGQGKMIFEEDNSYLSYEGEWKNNEMSGHGILNWKRPKGKTYTGEFKNNTINGQGKMIFEEDNQFLSYDGIWQNNQMSGHGELRWKMFEGKVYTGELKNDSIHGHGKMIFEKNNPYLSYTGEWQNNEMTGMGVLKWKKSFEGKIYTGEFRNNKINGKGNMTFDEESPFLSYYGLWKNNEMYEYGLLKWKRPTGKLYGGEIENNKINGHGIMFFEEKNPYLSYEGEWINNEMSGKGILKWKRPKGKIYSGEFKDNRIRGNGTISFADGTVFEGIFNDGEKTSDAAFNFVDDSHYKRYEGTFDFNSRRHLYGNGTLFAKNGKSVSGVVKSTLFGWGLVVFIDK